MLKIAYCGRPHTGGTYTVFRLLREGLAHHDIELRWVCLGSTRDRIPSGMEHETNFGEFIPSKSEEKKSAQKFVEHIENNYDGIIFNVLARKIETSTAKYISNKILKLQIVHNITPATYFAANTIRDYVHGTICPTPRIAKDLTAKFNFKPANTFTISHAVNLERFQKNSPPPNTDSGLKAVYLGRMDENAKGILWLPDIVRECLNNSIDLSLTVVGDGKDLEKLKNKSNQMGLKHHIKFYGKADYQDVPQIVSSHHVFIMPSRYEGFGYSLIENMASGCVPVCSQISGVTDFIVSNGDNGYLFPVGDVKQAAASITNLVEKEQWQKLSAQARTSVESRFSLAKQAESYADTIETLQLNPPKIAASLDVSRWELPSGLKPHWGTALPEPVKNLLRLWRERLTFGI